jgi:3-oxoacyl-[acyl-carrier-protein] synthase-3
MAYRSILAGVGGYLPRRVVTNDELAQRVDTSDAWIRERSGIRQRHMAEPHETATFMGAAAARQAMERAGADLSEVGAVLLGTTTSDQTFPSTAARVQAELGIKQGFAFDLSAACSGFIYGLSIADAMIRTGQIKGALVIGSEVMTRLLNWNDRGTCVLFGDGAGAAFLRAAPADSTDRGVLSSHLHSRGEFGDLLYADGGAGQPEKSGQIVMNGKEIFRHAVNLMSDAIDEALAANNLTQADIDLLVPHQANQRIIEGVAKRLRLPPERVIVTVDRHANTSAASIPLAMTVAQADGRLRPGQLVLFTALGGGLTWGSALVRM